MLNLRKTNPNKNNLINRRMFFLSFAKIIVFGGIIGRLFSLQISENKKYKTLSDKNRLREWKLPPKRGVIDDYFGNRIADNSQVFQLHMVPEDVEDFKTLFFRLKKIINLQDNEIVKISKKIKNQKPWQPIIISDNLTWSEFSRLNLFLHELSGVEPVVSVARKYPYEDTFAHTLGYVSAASVKDLNTESNLKYLYVPGLKIGKVGLEKLLDQQLLGEPGYQRYEVNAYGKRIKEIDIVEGNVGKSFRTTMDQEIQQYIKTLLVDKSGSVCIMDIFTGDIVAMFSSPSFDPNKFVHGISHKEWQKLIENDRHPLINKSVSALYPPGSTIKPIVALSALEFDVISPNFTVECTGKTELYGQEYHCWKKKGHGFMKLRNAIKQSCDTYFYEVARILGIDRLSVTAKKFGLGAKVLKNFPEEKKGLVPSTKWKLKNLGKGWVLGETLISGIGQGYFQTTPLQLCLMMAQIANGGYKIKPKIIADGSTWNDLIFKEKAQQSPQELESDNMYNFEQLYRNPENVKFVQEAVYASTNELYGTSYKSRHIEEKYVFAGKTGTSQVRRITAKHRELEIKNKDLPYEQRDHALYTAFAPYKNPRYSISIVIEHGGTGSSGAAPIGKKVIKKLIDRHSLRELQQQGNIQEI